MGSFMVAYTNMRQGNKLCLVPDVSSGPSSRLYDSYSETYRYLTRSLCRAAECRTPPPPKTTRDLLWSKLAYSKESAKQLLEACKILRKAVLVISLMAVTLLASLIYYWSQMNQPQYESQVDRVLAEIYSVENEYRAPEVGVTVAPASVFTVAYVHLYT